MHFTNTGVPINCDPSLCDDLGFEIIGDGNTRADRRIWPWERPPNWKTGENYPNPERASLHRWAWEFLFRNADFRKDHAENLSPLQREYGLKVRDGTSKREDERRHRQAEIEFFERWGIDKSSPTSIFDDMNDPHAPDTPFYFRAGTVKSHFPSTLKPEFSASGKAEKVFLFEAKQGEVPIVFNMAWPIEPQIKAAKRWLLVNQDGMGSYRVVTPIKSVRMHIAKFPSYLRVWDARKEGVTFDEIESQLSALFSDSADVRKSVENAESAAARFINEEHYKLIALGAKSGRAKSHK